MFLISVFIVFFLLMNGYFYGKIFNWFVPALKEISTTVLGVFTIFALFQVYVFIGIPLDVPVITYVIALAFILLLAPILCLFFKINIIPKKSDIIGFIFAFVATVALVMLSMPLNAGAMFFDSNYYLSKVIESSTSEVLAHVSNYSGSYLHRLDSLYDYQGYYYFWGMLLKLVRNFIFNSNVSLTPIYIWSASLTYYMSLGYLIFSCSQVLFEKISAKLIMPVLFITPYFINYFNTTLGFFGNTIKVLSIGLCLITYYLWFKTKDNRLFLTLPFIYLSGIAFSSSTFYLFIFLAISFFFALVFQNETNIVSYRGLTISCFPIVYYGFVILTNWDNSSMIAALALFALYGTVLGTCYILVKCSLKAIKKMISIFKVIFFLILLVLVVASWFLKDANYGYHFFFELRSLNDMTLNFTNNINIYECIRNSILWSLIALMTIKTLNKRGFSTMIVIAICLFLNPLTMPVVATYITGVVYSRTFELIINPLVLMYLVYLVGKCVNKRSQLIVSVIISVASIFLAVQAIQKPYSRVLLNDDNYNWEYKISESEFEMMNAMADEVVINGLERPLVLSQNFNIKGYVPNIELYFSTQDLRDTIKSEHSFNTSGQKKEVLLFYPRTYIDEELYGQKPDYKNLCPVIVGTLSDYVIMKTTLIHPNENGDFVPIWWEARACSDSIFDNDEWVILKVRK